MDARWDVLVLALVLVLLLLLLLRPLLQVL